MQEIPISSNPDEPTRCALERGVEHLLDLGYSSYEVINALRMAYVKRAVSHPSKGVRRMYSVEAERIGEMSMGLWGSGVNQ